MGFGYLFLGYLLAFLLRITADAPPLNAGAIAVLLGGILMIVGVKKLADYETSFRLSFFSVGLLLLANCYHLVKTVFIWTGATPVWMTEIEKPIVEPIYAAVILLVHIFLFPAIMRLAREVELPKTAAAAVRNLIFTGVWGTLYYAWFLIPESQGELKNAFSRVQVVVNVIVILLNLALLLSCMKNMAPEGEEDPEPHRYRWNFLNKIGDRFAGEHERAYEKKRSETEAYLRRKQEKRNRKRKK